MIIFKDNKSYPYLKDIVIKSDNKLLKIIYTQNNELLFDLIGKEEKNQDKDYQNKDEILMKNGSEEWPFFNRLINGILVNKSCDDTIGLIKNNVINWHSDGVPNQEANSMSIQRMDNGIKLTFLDNPRDTVDGFGVKVSNSESKYRPFNVFFMKMYNEFQVFSREKEETNSIKENDNESEER